MASQRALAVRRAEVLDRLNTAAASLAKRHGLTEPIAFGAPIQQRVDPELARVMEMERIADLLETIDGATAPKTTEPKAKGKKPAKEATEEPEGEGLPVEPGDGSGEMSVDPESEIPGHVEEFENPAVESEPESPAAED